MMHTIRHLIALLTGRPVASDSMPLVPVPKFPSDPEPRVLRRLDPPVRLDRMGPTLQREFWRRKHRAS